MLEFSTLFFFAEITCETYAFENIGLASPLLSALDCGRLCTFDLQTSWVIVWRLKVRKEIFQVRGKRYRRKIVHVTIMTWYENYPMFIEKLIAIFPSSKRHGVYLKRADFVVLFVLSKTNFSSFTDKWKICISALQLKKKMKFILFSEKAF